MSPNTKETTPTEWPTDQEDQDQPHQSIELNQFSTQDDSFLLNRPINRIEEIELVHRLDKRLLLFAMFGNLVKTMDNTNLGKKD
jgi:hypothetical protein